MSQPRTCFEGNLLIPQRHEVPTSNLIAHFGKLSDLIPVSETSLCGAVCCKPLSSFVYSPLWRAFFRLLYPVTLSRIFSTVLVELRYGHVFYFGKFLGDERNIAGMAGLSAEGDGRHVRGVCLQKHLF